MGRLLNAWAVQVRERRLGRSDADDGLVRGVFFRVSRREFGVSDGRGKLSTRGTATGGIVAPFLFSRLIGSGDRAQIADGYAVVVRFGC